MRILFVASLHHPETLRREQVIARENGTPLPLFPTSSSMHFWERAMLKRGYAVEVFWRNLSGFGDGSIDSLQAQQYTERITPQRIGEALMRRMPFKLNPDLQRRNQRLIDHANRFQPDVIWLVGDNTVIHADTLAQIKQTTRCKILYSCGTSPIVFSSPLERAGAPYYDLVVANDYYHGIQWRELGAKDMICLPGVAIDPDFHFPRQLSEQEQRQYACDVSFVGTLLPAHLYSERVEALEALGTFDLGIWSVHHLPSALQSFYRGSALGDEMLKVLSASKMTINPHGNFMRYGGNMRLFEAAAVGTLQIVDDRPGIHEWFTEKEHLIIYRSLDDLREQVHYYLSHDGERQQIIQQAREHVIKHHTYDNRLDRLEDAGIFRANSPTD